MKSTSTTFPLGSWRFICISSASMLFSWRLNYALPSICQQSKQFIIRFSRFLQNATPSKADGRITFTDLVRRLLSPSLDRRRGMSTPAPRLLLSKVLLPSPPERRADALLRMNSMPNKTSFMKSVAHDCQVDHSHWNFYTACSKVGG